MTYEPHARLVTPPDDAVLWRYLDLAKFLQLLETQSLWFTRTDQFEDPLEASYTDAELSHLRSLEPSVGESYIRAAAFTRATTFVDCWRAGADESLAMWELYGKGSGVVAIKSTVGRLKESVATHASPVYVAEVKYIDWKDAPWDNNTLAMCVRKVLAYKHESEVRAMIWDHSKTTKQVGLSVPVDACRLITEVIVGPREQSWVHKLVERIIRRYGFGLDVIHSDLLRPRF